MKKQCSLFWLAIILAFCVVLLFPAGASAGTEPDNSEEEIQMPPEDEVPPTARVLLSNYSLEQTGDAEGTSYTLHITLENKGTADAYNVLLTFEDESYTFLPAYGTSNQIHIPSIGAAASAAYDIPLVAEGSVEGFVLFFSMEYMNPESTVRSSLYIGSFTGQPADAVQLFQMEKTGTANAEGNTPVRLTIANRSSQRIEQLTLQVYIPITDTRQSFELNPLEAGETREDTNLLQLPKGRIQQVRVSLVYQDEAGVSYTTPETLFTLYSDQTGGAGGDGTLTGADDLQPFMVEIIVHLVLIGVVVVWLLVIWIKRRRSAPTISGSAARKRSEKRNEG